ncbi:hypothetical protein OTU49_000236, partial [Cherax quadricarinatus]
IFTKNKITQMFNKLSYKVLVVVLAATSPVWAWPEGQPNCPLKGEWEDVQGREGLVVEVLPLPPQTTPPRVPARLLSGHKQQQQPQDSSMGTYLVNYYSTTGRYNGTTPVHDLKSTALELSSTSGPTNTVLMLLTCSNDVLWALQTPQGNNQRVIRVFTLRKKITTPPSSIPTKTQVIVVNITLPKRQEDGTYDDAARMEAPPNDDTIPDVPAQNNAIHEDVATPEDSVAREDAHAFA